MTSEITTIYQGSTGDSIFPGAAEPKKFNKDKGKERPGWVLKFATIFLSDEQGWWVIVEIVKPYSHVKL